MRSPGIRGFAALLPSRLREGPGEGLSGSSPSLEIATARPRDTCPTLCPIRSEEHTSELQSLMRTSYAVFCLNKKTTINIKKTIIIYRDNNNCTHTVSHKIK